MTPVQGDEEDLTKRERREQARASRKAAEEAAAASTARNKRVAQLGGAVAVVVVAIVVILIATSGGSKAKVEGSHTKGGQEKIAEVEKEIGGIPQKGNVLGTPTAPVTLVYFGDLECPICREFTLGALPTVIEKWVKTGKVKIEYRNLETATREPETFRSQQTAALAAGVQNKGWYYIELFYHQQGEEDTGYVTESFLQGIAQQVPGLNLSQWSSDRNNNTFAKQIEKDAEAASNAGFNGTPSFMLGKGTSLKNLTSSEYGTLTDASGFDTAIEKALHS